MPFDPIDEKVLGKKPPERIFGHEMISTYISVLAANDYLKRKKSKRKMPPFAPQFYIDSTGWNRRMKNLFAWRVKDSQYLCSLIRHGKMTLDRQKIEPGKPRGITYAAV